MSTVLIVDDDPTARETLVAMLEGEDYDLQLAKDGIQALQMLEQLQPDLILLDVMMPGMDGYRGLPPHPFHASDLLRCRSSSSLPWMTATPC